MPASSQHSGRQEQGQRVTANTGMGTQEGTVGKEQYLLKEYIFLGCDNKANVLNATELDI